MSNSGFCNDKFRIPKRRPYETEEEDFNWKDAVHKAEVELNEDEDYAEVKTFEDLEESKLIQQEEENEESKKNNKEKNS
jgi:hypothetical protein